MCTCLLPLGSTWFPVAGHINVIPLVAGQGHTRGNGYGKRKQPWGVYATAVNSWVGDNDRGRQSWAVPGGRPARLREFPLVRTGKAS